MKIDHEARKGAGGTSYPILGYENSSDDSSSTAVSKTTAEKNNPENKKTNKINMNNEIETKETAAGCGENQNTIPAPVGFWNHPVKIAGNNFIHKSLSDWACNIAVGCTHGCKFCYVPHVSAMKQKPALTKLGVTSPSEDWGKYVFLRPFDEAAFRASLRAAQRTPGEKLSEDGHRAVMLCTTTDPYQVIFHGDKERREELNTKRAGMVRRILELIRDESDLNVRILTRSPLVRQDFDLLKSLGNRVVLGVSLPTLRHDLAAVYEPGAPAPARRLELLKKASEEGIPVAVMMAPTFPECDRADMEATMRAIAPLNPVTVFHEPINVRADNAERIASEAKLQGVVLKTAVFATPEAWRQYALQAFADVEAAARAIDLYDRLHLWVDGALGTAKAIKANPNPEAYQAWVNYWWGRISEWPGEERAGLNSAEASVNPFASGEEQEVAA